MAIVPSKQLVSTFVCSSSKRIPVIASDCSWASKMHYELRRSQTLTVPSSSPEIKRVSLAKWTRLMGFECAFLIRWAIFPVASMNPNLLSSPQVARAALFKSYCFRSCWIDSDGHWSGAIRWQWRGVKLLQNYTWVSVAGEVHLYMSVDEGSCYDILGRVEVGGPDMKVIWCKVEGWFNDGVFVIHLLLLFYSFIPIFVNIIFCK